MVSNRSSMSESYRYQIRRLLFPSEIERENAENLNLNSNWRNEYAKERVLYLLEDCLDTLITQFGN